MYIYLSKGNSPRALLFHRLYWCRGSRVSTALHLQWRCSWQTPARRNVDMHIRTGKHQVTLLENVSTFFLVTISSTAGWQSSWRSACSALAHVVFCMSNLRLNLNPASTYTHTHTHAHSIKWWTTIWTFLTLAPHPVLLRSLPVWWRGQLFPAWKSECGSTGS